jgi:WhiB family redox-sensing transcriptional regulator
MMPNLERLPGALADHWDWQLEAACRGMPSSFFFHPWSERGPAREAREAVAKSICGPCPALAACRTHALTLPERYGVWGGLSETERGGTRARVMSQPMHAGGAYHSAAG